MPGVISGEMRGLHNKGVDKRVVNIYSYEIEDVSIEAFIFGTQVLDMNEVSVRNMIEQVVRCIDPGNNLILGKPR